MISSTNILPEKKAPIHSEAFAVVSNDVQTRIIDEDDKSAVRSTSGIPRLQRAVVNQPPKPSDVAGEIIELRNFNRLDSE